jgi:hypothetical protein
MASDSNKTLNDMDDELSRGDHQTQVHIECQVVAMNRWTVGVVNREEEPVTFAFWRGDDRLLFWHGGDRLLFWRGGD